MSKLLGVVAAASLFGTLGTVGCGYSAKAAPSVVSGSITLLPSPVNMNVNQTVQLTALHITDGPNGIGDVTQTALWQSSSSDLPVVSGKATCKKTGNYTVSAATMALTGTSPITCSAPSNGPSVPTPTTPPTPTPTSPAAPPTPTPVLAGISILNPPGVVRSSVPYALSVQGTYANKSTSDVTSQISWRGDSVARVSAAGVIYCNTGGQSTVTATIGAFSSAAQVVCLMKPITGPPGFAEFAAKFYGPFPSWLNLRDFGAKGDGVTDDTQAIQAAMTAATAQGKTLWMPNGRYVVNGTVQVVGADGISIIGEDPLNTEVIWRGPVGGTMITFQGTTHFRIRRVSFDCNNNSADTGIDIGFDQTKSGQNYPTYNAVEDLKLTRCNKGVKDEYAGETTVNRVHFDGNNYAASLENWNALNFNVTDSLFTDNNIGLSNMNGAGAFNVSNSVFVRSKVTDMEMGNTSAFSIRHNLSVGSTAFFHAFPINSNAAVTIEGNTVVDTVNVPILYGNQGTVTLLDNTFDMPSYPQRPLFTAAGWIPTFLLAVGNTYTTTNPYEVQAGSKLNLTIFDEAPQAALPTSSYQVPTEVYIPPASTSPVIEVSASATSDEIQTALNDAKTVPGGATVHLPNTSYFFNSTLDAPAAPGLAIIGDGQNTDLRAGPMLDGPLLRLHGAVELDGLFVSSSSTGQSIQIMVPDQPSTTVLCDECTTVNTQQSMRVSGLDHATINTRASTLNGTQGVSITGGAIQASGQQTLGRMDAFMSTSDTYRVSNGGHFLISDGWHDGNQSSVQAIVSGNSQVTHEGGSIVVASAVGVQAVGLTGQLSMVGTQIQTPIVADATSTGTIGLIGSITGATDVQLNVAGSSVKVVHGDDTILTHIGVTKLPPTPVATADIERALSQSVTEFVVPRQPLTAPATLVRIHRVMTGDGAVGIEITSDGTTTGVATYTITDPSGSSASNGCPTGTASLDGSWTLISGGDGYYGLLNGGIYLSNTVSATDGTPSLATAASMTDAGQRWLMQPAGDGLFHILNRADGSSLTRTASGCAALGAATGDTTQEWAVTAK